MELESEEPQYGWNDPMLMDLTPQCELHHLLRTPMMIQTPCQDWRFLSTRYPAKAQSGHVENALTLTGTVWLADTDAADAVLKISMMHVFQRMCAAAAIPVRGHLFHVKLLDPLKHVPWEGNLTIQVDIMASMAKELNRKR